MKVTVRDVYEYFGYRRICGDDKSMEREITEVACNRPGLELFGYFDYLNNRIVVLGEKETHFINQMRYDHQINLFNIITDRAPMILISRDLPCPNSLVEVANAKNYPVFSSYAHTGSLITELSSYLEEELADIESIHGVLLNIYGRGALITGSSGMGKSEVALELIKRGHTLIADDRVDVYRAHNKIYGQAPEVLREMLELRGVGIINIANMFGVTAVDDETRIDLVIDLKSWDEGDVEDRLGLDNNQVENIFGVDIPKITIPVSTGRSVAPIIEASVTNLILKQRGIDTNEVFHQRVLALIEQNSRK